MPSSSIDGCGSSRRGCRSLRSARAPTHSQDLPNARPRTFASATLNGVFDMAAKAIADRAARQRIFSRSHVASAARRDSIARFVWPRAAKTAPCASRYRAFAHSLPLSGFTVTCPYASNHLFATVASNGADASARSSNASASWPVTVAQEMQCASVPARSISSRRIVLSRILPARNARSSVDARAKLSRGAIFAQSRNRNRASASRPASAACQASARCTTYRAVDISPVHWMVAATRLRTSASSTRYSSHTRGASACNIEASTQMSRC